MAQLGWLKSKGGTRSHSGRPSYLLAFWAQHLALAMNWAFESNPLLSKKAFIITAGRYTLITIAW